MIHKLSICRISVVMHLTNIFLEISSANKYNYSLLEYILYFLSQGKNLFYYFDNIEAICSVMSPCKKWYENVILFAATIYLKRNSLWLIQYPDILRCIVYLAICNIIGSKIVGHFIMLP